MPFDLEPGWAWLIGGTLLLIAEVLVPGVFLLFVGAAAMLTGVFALLFDLGAPAQLALFALYTALAVMIGRRVYGRPQQDDGDDLLNDRAAQMIGRQVMVVSPVDEHGGRVKVGDGEWSARGDHAGLGDLVRVVAVEGNCLKVERLAPLPPPGA
jgi:membrane protein implicated in regulation of membrane protease activity